MLLFTYFDFRLTVLRTRISQDFYGIITHAIKMMPCYSNSNSCILFYSRHWETIYDGKYIVIRRSIFSYSRGLFIAELSGHLIWDTYQIFMIFNACEISQQNYKTSATTPKWQSKNARWKSIVKFESIHLAYVYLKSIKLGMNLRKCQILIR